MKITKVTREYFTIEGEKVYFDPPLDYSPTVEEMQKLWDDANAHINNLLNTGKLVRRSTKTEENDGR